MKLELLKDGRVVDTIIGGEAWVSTVLTERIRLTGADHTREVADDTPDLLKTSSGKPFWMGQ